MKASILGDSIYIHCSQLRGHLQCLETLLVVTTWRGGCYQVEARMLPAIILQRAIPSIMNYSTPNVNSARAVSQGRSSSTSVKF